MYIMLHCSVFVYSKVLSDMQVLGSHYYTSVIETQTERDREKANIWPFEKPLVYKQNFNDQILTDKRQRHRQEDSYACSKLQEKQNFLCPCQLKLKKLGSTKVAFKYCPL